MTGSAVAALVAAALTGVLMAALLAVFSIKYLVNQVVLGVVLVVFASGITGYLFDQFLQSDAAGLNTPDVLAAVKIPVLGDIPFIGPILFNQTVLVYLTYLAVALVTFVLFQTRWGLRVRGRRRAPQGGRHRRHQGQAGSATPPCCGPGCWPVWAARSSRSVTRAPSPRT
jgi:simple sugar transport system permease protein